MASDDSSSVLFIARTNGGTIPPTWDGNRPSALGTPLRRQFFSPLGPSPLADRRQLVIIR